MRLKPAIPEFSLSEAVRLSARNPDRDVDYTVTTFSAPVELDGTPHRASYFGIAICLEGSVSLVADLELYQLLPGSLIVMAPEVIRTWRIQSPDYKEETLFFTERFFLEAGLSPAVFKEFRFFQTEVPKVIQLSPAHRTLIEKLLLDIKRITAAKTQRKDAMVRSYISILLNQVADLYDQYCPAVFAELPAPIQMVSGFKKLLLEKHLQLRSVNGYADLLNVSSKHLSQTIKEHTGKTAGEWIHDVLILEAKVRLMQTSLSIAQIAEALNFSDPSLFGKYFRRYAGCSPGAYRKRLST